MSALNDNELKKLLNFIGYGNKKAAVWFIGMEEGGGEDNIQRRIQFSKTIMDCAEAHKILGVKDYHIGRPRIQRTWRGMCYIMLCLADTLPNRESIRKYQSDFLGRANGKTLLCELMPIPKSKIIKWPYRDLIPQYTGRMDYYKTVRPARIRILKDLIKQCSPKIVICYGKKFWPSFEEIFDKHVFEKYNSFPFQVASNEGTTVILTHHLSRISNDVLESVVKAIKCSGAVKTLGVDSNCRR